MEPIVIDIIHTILSFILSFGLVMSTFITALLIFINYKINSAQKNQIKITHQKKQMLIDFLSNEIEKTAFLSKQEKHIFKDMIRSGIEKII